MVKFTLKVFFQILLLKLSATNTLTQLLVSMLFLIR